MHDFQLLKNSMPAFGHLTDIMTRPDIPQDSKPTIVVDKGYIGIKSLLPGTRIMIPVKRKMGSDDGELSQQDRDHNRAVAQVRYIVEHCMGWIKLYEMMRRTYRGTPTQFEKDLNIVTGLVNLKRLQKYIRKEHADLIRKVTEWRGNG